jgi:hypothetical protein
MTYNSPLKELTWKDLTVAGPVIGSIFAFAYVVGYFFAFDIAWFSFFTFSEHLVFALRALPVAIAASVFFIIVLALAKDRHWSEWLKHKHRQFSIWWIFLLIALSLFVFASNHLALGVCLISVAAGTAVYYRLRAQPPPFANIVSLGVNLTIGCLIFGFASGYLARFNDKFPFGGSMIILSMNDGNPPQQLVGRGHVIFVGASAMLYYDYDRKRVRLLRRDDIIEICGCRRPDCLTECGKQENCTTEDLSCASKAN